MSFESLFLSKTRSFLSMLGIIIGVSTVIAVFAIGKGAQQAVSDQFEGLSAKSLIVMGSFGRGATASSKLTVEDVKVIKESVPEVALITGIIQGEGPISYNYQERNFSILGTDLSYYEIAKMRLLSGRLFSEEELKGKATVAMIGNGVFTSLYQEDEEPLGTTINVNGKRFEVIGVFKESGGNFGRLNKDDSVYIPYLVADSGVLGKRSAPMITIEVDKVENVKIVNEKITEVLRTEHKLRNDQENDFRIMDAGSMVGAAEESAKLMTILLTAIAAITLLVSGIGIMNVMFVTVAERTKEIGIAKAIGGKQFDILSQFLMESIILSTVGGLIGIIIGQIAIPIIAHFNIISLQSSSLGPIIGFSFSVIVGVVFGFYPAFKASRLDPVDALRSE